MSSRVVTPWILASLVGMLLATGCYTMIVHPRVENERPDGEELRVACIDCHADYHVYPYDPYDTYFGADYYWHYPRYGYYYGYPWWWDDYYWHYYFSPDDPGVYPPNPRDISRAAYRGGLPHRAPDAGGDAGTLMPTVDSRGNPVPPRRGTDPAVGVLPGDTTGGAGAPTRSADMLTPLPGGGRSVGQPPWIRPSGGAGAKPPALRSDSIARAGQTTTPPPSGDKNATATGTTNPPPAAKDNPPAEEKPANTGVRGRPKRKP